MSNYIPNDTISQISQDTQEFSEDLLEFLALLIEEDLRLNKQNKAPPE